MFTITSFRRTIHAYAESFKRDSLVWFNCLVQNKSVISSMSKASAFAQPLHYITYVRSYGVLRPFLGTQHISLPFDYSVMKRLDMFQCHSVLRKWLHSRYLSNTSIELKTDGGAIRFSINKHCDRNGSLKKVEGAKRVKMSKRAKLNELKFYRLKAKRKMNSPNPEVRIRYKLEKAKRKETWLIEKLRKFELPKGLAEKYDPEILTEEERHYLKRTGEKKKNYVQVGRRGVFGGVVLNMHLHWKKHETVKVVCKPCKPGQIDAYAEELARLSRGIVIDIKPDNTIIFYRGKNYMQPEVMSPPNTLSKNKALEKYKYEQSLEHTSGFIEKLEHELEEYQKHIALYKKGKEVAPHDSLAKSCRRKLET